MKKLIEIPDYPKTEGERTYYVKHPVQKKNGKWVGASVAKSGYYSVERDPSLVEHGTEESCQLACDFHNSFHGWDKDTANYIVSCSMKNTQIELFNARHKN